MAGHDKLQKFVRKFDSLWQSGCNARLHVETEAGNAFVSLQVGLGQANPLPGRGQHSMLELAEEAVQPSNVVESAEKLLVKPQLQLNKLLLQDLMV